MATGVYTAGVTLMYGVSAAYHRGRCTPAVRRRMRRLDHSTILVGIAATYTPIEVFHALVLVAGACFYVVVARTVA